MLSVTFGSHLKMLELVQQLTCCIRSLSSIEVSGLEKVKVKVDMADHRTRSTTRCFSKVLRRAESTNWAYDRGKQ
jgi:hypothetical protein